MAGLPLTWTELSESELKHLRASFPLPSSGVPAMGDDLVMYSNGVPMPRAYTTIADRVYNFQCRPDDVWVVTYPKCGTTWTQEIVWNLMQGAQVGGVSKLTNKQVSEFQIERISEWLFDRSPFIDLPMLKGHTLEEAEQFFAKVEALPSPRTIKVLAIILKSI